MTPEDLVLFARTADPAVKDCQDAVHKKQVKYRGSALLGAAEARQLIQTKKANAEREHARLGGFEALLAAIEHLAPAKKISIHHFQGERVLFSVAFEQGENQPLGGIGVWQTPADVRHETPPGAMAAATHKDLPGMGKH